MYSYRCKVRNLTIFNNNLKIEIFVLIYKVKCNSIYIFNFNDNYYQLLY